MRFGEFWRIMRDDLQLSKDFQTLKQNRLFNAVLRDGLILVTPNTTMFERKIKQEEFLVVWNLAKNLIQTHNSYGSLLCLKVPLWQ